MELLIVLVLIGLLALIAAPSFRDWFRNAQYREVAQNISSALRGARAMAISTNLEHQVEFDIDGTPQRYRTTQGTQAYGSTVFNEVVPWVSIPPGILIRADDDCLDATDVNIQFNPNGTGNAQWICIMESAPTPVRKFQAGVTTPTTARVAIRR